VQIAQGVLWVKTSSSGLVHPTLSHSLLELGFSSSQVDPSLFVYHTKGSHIFLLVYVDDIIVIGNNAATMQSLIAKLQADFAMKDLGPLSYFLGIQTLRTPLASISGNPNTFRTSSTVLEWPTPSHTKLPALLAPGLGLMVTYCPIQQSIATLSMPSSTAPLLA
jgi:hypothetical protein